MSNLTGQQINQTYPGLLNLETATTGITSSLQSIQDGLGNNTGMRIAVDSFSHPQVFGLRSYAADFYGNGWSNTGVAPVATSFNKLICIPIIDQGIYSYSGISYWVVTSTTTSDVVTLAFYDTQYVSGYGVAPRNLIQSGITLTTNSTGLKNDNLATALSFSGTGPGLYWMVLNIANAGVAPTIRFGQQQLLYSAGMQALFGGVASASNTNTNQMTRNGNAFNLPLVLNTPNFQSSFSSTDIVNFWTTTAGATYGIGLRTIK